MSHADVFIISDNLQFERHDFQNRNLIRTPQGIKWLTVPVKHNGNGNLVPINEVEIADGIDAVWHKRHWETLRASYVNAPYWDKYENFFEETYKREWKKLIDLNMYIISGLRKFLGIKTQMVMASSLRASGKKNELLVKQCKEMDADVYLSGLGAKSYIDVELFKKEGIEVKFQDFQQPTYRQMQKEFAPHLSVVDYLFCTGQKMEKNETSFPSIVSRSCFA